MFEPSSYCGSTQSIAHVFYNGWMMKYMYIIKKAREKIHVQNLVWLCVYLKSLQNQFIKPLTGLREM